MRKIAAVLLLSFAGIAQAEDGFFTRKVTGAGCYYDPGVQRMVCINNPFPPVRPACNPVTEVMACTRAACSCQPAAQCRLTIDWASNDAPHPSVTDNNPVIACTWMQDTAIDAAK